MSTPGDGIQTSNVGQLAAPTVSRRAGYSRLDEYPLIGAEFRTSMRQNPTTAFRRAGYLILGKQCAHSAFWCPRADPRAGNPGGVRGAHQEVDQGRLVRRPITGRLPGGIVDRDASINLLGHVDLRSAASMSLIFCTSSRLPGIRRNPSDS